MNQLHERFLTFGHHKIPFFTNTQGYFIAMKPVCQALSVDWSNEFKRVNRDPILSSRIVKFTIRDSTGRHRSMICVPEKYVYGWLFSLPASTPEAIAYKIECYDAVYQRFRGSIQRFAELVHYVSVMQAKKKSLVDEMMEHDQYRKLLEFDEEITKAKRDLAKAQKRVITDFYALQGDLFPDE